MNDDMNHARRYPSDDASDPRNGAHPAVELLSEYLDAPDDLSTGDREAIEQHLTGCAECQATLQELQIMVQTLSTLPEREAPRSFALTPDMLEPAKTPDRPAPVVLQDSPQWHARHADKIRWATAVAAMLFVFVISADLVTNGLGGRTGSSDDAADMDTVSMQRQADDGEEQTTLRFEDDAADEAQPESEDLDQEQPESDEDLPDGTFGEEAAEEESADEPPAQDADEEMPASDTAGSGEDGESTDATPADESDAALGTSGGEAEEESGEAEMSTMLVEEGEESEEAVAEATNPESSSLSTWRIVEFSLALVLALLLTVMIGLPRQRGARRR